MPRYTYKCNNCGYTEEAEHGIHADVTIRCPMDEEVMHRVIFAVGAQFKGDGWARDGYS